MDAVTDPTVERVTWMKSARVGATKIMNCIVGYYIEQDPCPIMVVQPTEADAEGYSKEELAPMIRDCPSISGLFGNRSKSSGDTILHKLFPGGSVSIVGANSGRGFRRTSRKIVLLDEVDGYPVSAGDDGDPVRLAIMRSQFYWDRKIFACSTPLLKANSRIEQMFLQGDQRYYLVPCPHCNHEARLVLREENGAHHWMSWPNGKPELAHFICCACGCSIEHSAKHQMIVEGRWVAESGFSGHASFHSWAAYSSSPNASWGQLATEYEQAVSEGPEKIKTWINVVQGQSYEDEGDSPDTDSIYSRREPYLGTVPEGVNFLTAGVDVQGDRFVFEVVGWGDGRESWSVDAGELFGDTASETTWEKLDALLERGFSGPGGDMRIRVLAIDSGYRTQMVYSWARKYPMTRVMAVKGVAGVAKAFVSSPSRVDVTRGGKRVGYRVWPVAVEVAKSELYGWLGLSRGEDGSAPPGYCHFPEYHAEFFNQLTSEQLVSKKNRRGDVVLQWCIKDGRQNHFLDARIYSRAAAAMCGIDRATPRGKARIATEQGAAEAPSAASAGPVPAQHARQPRRRAQAPRGWLSR
jgi:phage terminase large subunit GpA-like protein